MGCLTYLGCAQYVDSVGSFLAVENESENGRQRLLTTYAKIDFAVGGYWFG